MTDDAERVIDGAPVDFFSMIPHLVDDSSLSAHAIRLYLHLKRVAGETGLCWQTQDTLAKHCHFTPRTIVRAKQALIAAGLIELIVEVERGNAYHVIRLLNLWPDNHSKYTAVSDDTAHGIKGSSTAVSLGHSKNTPVRIPPEEEGGRKPRKRAAPDGRITEVFDAVLKHLGNPEVDPIPNHDKEARFVKKMLNRGLTAEYIVDFWKTKVRQKGGGYVTMVYVNEDIPVPGVRQASLLPTEAELMADAAKRGL